MHLNIDYVSAKLVELKEQGIDIKFYPGDEDNTDKGRMKLIELEKRITAKLNSMRSDFSYGTYCRLHDDHILVKSDGLAYTDRKFNNLINRSIEGSDLSLSDFNIEKNHNNDTNDWFIKITTN